MITQTEATRRHNEGMAAAGGRARLERDRKKASIAAGHIQRMAEPLYAAALSQMAFDVDDFCVTSDGAKWFSPVDAYGRAMGCPVFAGASIEDARRADEARDDIRHRDWVAVNRKEVA
jgi:hypothetical protein